ncbi:ATP phosphoribosyltransferase regulatory subunit [Caldinitratiruptor microaerophilus]|uniref:ATP phosphoribosyltransferase regulatory subunit n=1 Tax=Caldinitratiruptor microaerophilus TaxID=671077 RepID=A0AA35CP35_9FIRM|nr:ATP phosphoribosyltransferase regulatory subunit [Caldinitratiruptor microaerophilus]BDG61272.1 hypothetical protein caldi_23620 [Caldinitratiruptor microaerophilus]
MLPETLTGGFPVPDGVKDRLPRETARLRRLEDRLLEVFRLWGYREVMTPAFEFLETALAGQEARARREDYYQLFDRRGRTLVLRPDMTAPIARLAASRAAVEPLPLRYSYRGPVFRRRGHRYGELHEVWQAGVELIGARGMRADAEIIALACDALARAGLQGYKVGVGHVAVVEGLLARAGVPGSAAADLKEALAARDLVAFERLAREAAPAGADLLVDMASFTGSAREALGRFGGEPGDPVRAALEEIDGTLRLLAGYGVEAQVCLDLGLARHFGYYTGIVFEAYAPGVGAPVLGGGRYDRLLAAFAGDGAGTPATGFALDLDRVLQALERQGGPEPEDEAPILLVPAPGAEALAHARARELRAAGRVVEVELDGLEGEALEAYVRARGVAEVVRVEAAGAAGPASGPGGSAAAGPSRPGRPGAAPGDRDRRGAPRPGGGVTPIH